VKKTAQKPHFAPISGKPDYNLATRESFHYGTNLQEEKETFSDKRMNDLNRIMSYFK
jgi:hypothetical protein